MTARAPLRRLVYLAAPLLSLVAGITLLIVARPEATRGHQKLGEAEDVTALPAPAQVEVFSLGYRAALADYLFATTLVRAGRYFGQKRNFLELANYLRVILHLDPDFRAVYQYADSLLTLNTVMPPPENYRRARDILELGLQRFPTDAELWLSTAQFMLYLAPPWLPPSENPAEWKARGAGILQRACELKAHDPPLGCISSFKALANVGEAQAGIDALRRMLALSDDPEFRLKLETKLAELLSVTERARFEERAQEMTKRHVLDLPLATRAEYQFAGPKLDPVACLLGRGSPCETSFRDLHPSVEPPQR